MEETLNIEIKSSLIGKSKQLIVAKEYIQLSSNGDNKIRFDKQDIVAYRFGVHWIKGLEFTIGREYRIFLKDSFDCTLKISFRSLYRNKLAEKGELFQSVMKSIWVNYFDEIVTNYLNQVANGETIRICNVEISDKNVTIEPPKMLNKRKVTIPWQHLGTKNYQTYYALFSDENPIEINCMYRYLEDWNTGVLYSVIETLKSQLNSNPN